MNAISLDTPLWWRRSPVGRSTGLSPLPHAWLQRVCTAVQLMVSRTSNHPAGGVAAAEEADQADLNDVRAAVSGDGDAYARLVRRHQEAVGRVMWRFSRDRLQWEELVQDVFVEAYVSLPRYRARAPLIHWLRKIAVRVGYRYWRRRDRQRRETPLSLRDWDQVLGGQADPADAREAAEIVQAMLQRVAPRDRLVLTLIYLEGCSVAEAARLAGWTQTMVKVQAHRARKRLKRLLQQARVEP